MVFALVNNKKTLASPKLRGKCPHCGNDVISKCGRVRVHHWAHLFDYSCDSWQSFESEWHMNWKAKFGTEYSEIKIQKGNVYHIADVQNKSGVVIEFQNSPISKFEILAREEFYGKMIWVINGMEFKKNFFIGNRLINRDDVIPENFTFKIDDLEGPCWVLSLNNKELSHSKKKWLLSRGFSYDMSQNRCYFKGYEKTTKWAKWFLNEIHRINDDQEIYNLKPDERYFSWTYRIKSWDFSKKPLFIDFGDDYLYWIRERYTNEKGKLKIITKKKFLKKYKD